MGFETGSSFGCFSLLVLMFWLVGYALAAGKVLDLLSVDSSLYL